MSARSSQLPVSVYDVPVADRKSKPVAELMTIAAENAATAVSPDAGTRCDPERKTRYRIWDLHTSLHCSIIGTCLTQGELVRLLRRLKVEGVDTANDHDLHMLGVLLAARPKEGAKFLQKVLDHRHSAAIKRFAKAHTGDDLLTLWTEAMNGGDIPGAYWAVLTHPTSSDKLTRRVFGDVHILSHLVGGPIVPTSTACASWNDRMPACSNKSTRSRSGCAAVSRNATRPSITSTNCSRARPKRNGGQLRAPMTPAIGLRWCASSNAGWTRRSRAGTPPRRTWRWCRGPMRMLSACASTPRTSATPCSARFASIEAQLESVLRPEDELPSGQLDLASLSVLYVGGRANQVPQLRALVERVNGQFLHHDGGLEDNAALLPGLISRAEVAVFPVDCISHNAAAAVKRFCEQIGRPYIPLRTSSLSCLLSALTALRQQASVHTLQWACNRPSPAPVNRPGRC